MEKEKKEEWDKHWKTIATKAVTDETFKKKLVANPVGVMQENGLTLPEGTEMKIGAGNEQTIPLPSNAPDDLKDEIKWWLWRLASIRELGKEDPKKEVGHHAMSSQEAEEDESGIF